jgi:hypothetical protein
MKKLHQIAYIIHRQGHNGLGAAYMLALRSLHPELYTEIVDTEIDPKGKDNRIPTFLAYMEGNIENV